MKTLKYLTICLAVCCLFTGSVFAQACGSLGGTISIIEDGTGDNPPGQPPINGPELFSCTPGTVIWWKVEFNIAQNDLYPTGDWVNREFKFPDGSIIPGDCNAVDFDDNFFLTPMPNIIDVRFAPFIETYWFGPYTTDVEDLGGCNFDCNENPTGVAADRWSGTVCLQGSCYPNYPSKSPADFPQGDVLTRSVAARLEPCIDITKEACDWSKVGDVITYTYTVTNCGVPIGDPADPDIVPPTLQVTELLDTNPDLESPHGNPVPVLNGKANLLPAFSVANGGSVDLPWSNPPVPVVFTATYTVPAGEASPVINFVDVNSISLEATVPFTAEDFAQAQATETVTLLEPNFIVTVRCEVGDTRDDGTSPSGLEQRFYVQYENTGDVDLNITDNIASAFTLTGVLPPEIEEWVDMIPAGGGSACGGGASASLQVNAEGRIPSEFCELPNVISKSSNQATCTVGGCDDDWTVEKECLTSPWNDGAGPCNLQGGGTAQYKITITNTGDCPLIFDVNDPGVTLIELDGVPVAPVELVDYLVGPLAGDANAVLIGQEPVPTCLEPGQNIEMDENVVTVRAFCVSNGLPATKSSDTAEATCCYSCPGGEGCTPGFWKNHPLCWCNTYTEATLVSDVFTSLQSAPYDTVDDDDRKSNFFGGPNPDTLADSIRYRGGSGLAGTVRNMLRHATAALLNGCSNDVAYPVSDGAVIIMVNFALDSQDIGMIQDVHTLLAMWNEESPCPIDAHCRVKDDINGD